MRYSTMAKNHTNFQMDSRLVNINIKRGNITKEEYDKFVKSLPDLSDQAEEISCYEDEFEGDANLTFSM